MFYTNHLGFTGFVLSSKTLIHEKPLIHEACWTHRSMKYMAAVREVPKSSHEWEMPGGHLWCSTNVSSTENKWNLAQFYCCFGRPAVIFYLLPPFCWLSPFGRSNPSSRALLSSTLWKTSKGKLCSDFGVSWKCCSPDLVLTFPKSTVTSQLSVASTNTGSVPVPSALQGNYPGKFLKDWELAAVPCLEQPHSAQSPGAEAEWTEHFSLLLAPFSPFGTSCSVFP